MLFKRETLIDFLMQEGYFINLEEANTYIMSGQVFVDDERIIKPDEKIPSNPKINIISNNASFSTDSLKLDQALASFNIDIYGLICLDISAVRGGITTSLINNGARGVFTLCEDKNSLSQSLSENKSCYIAETSLDIDSILNTCNIYNKDTRLAVLHNRYKPIRELIPYLHDILPSGIIIWHLRPILENNLILKSANKNSCKMILDEIIYEISSQKNLAINNIMPCSFTQYSSYPEFMLSIQSGIGQKSFSIDESALDTIIDIAIENSKIK